MKRVTSELFISTWVRAHKESRNQRWVATELGLAHQAVSQRAKRMRSRGVKLPELPLYSQGEKSRLNKQLHQELAK